MAARHDPAAPAARILAAARGASSGASSGEPGIEARLLCGAAGRQPPPGTRIFQPFADGSFLAEAEPGHDANELSQSDADLLRRLGQWLSDWPPGLVHLHDLSPFGMEFIGLVRRLCPEARLLLSLTPELAGRLGITGLARGFLHQAPLRRFLAETLLLLPCESLIPACVAFGLEPERLVVQPGLPPQAPSCPMPPTGRFLVVACCPGDAAQHALLAATAALLARFPEAPLLEIRPPAEAADALAAAQLLLLPDAEGADPEGLARLALAMGRPVISAAQGPVAQLVQPGRDGWHAAMNPTALAHLLLDLAEAPGQVSAMAGRLQPPAAPALFARYREWAADPARIAPPARI